MSEVRYNVPDIPGVQVTESGQVFVRGKPRKVNKNSYVSIDGVDLSVFALMGSAFLDVRIDNTKYRILRKDRSRPLVADNLVKVLRHGDSWRSNPKGRKARFASGEATNLPPDVPGEIWKPFPDAPGYLVSNKNRAWKIGRFDPKTGKGKFGFEPIQNADGAINVWIDGQHKWRAVPAAVREAFHGGA